MLLVGIFSVAIGAFAAAYFSGPMQIQSVLNKEGVRRIRSIRSTPESKIVESRDVFKTELDREKTIPDSGVEPGVEVDTDYRVAY